MSVCENDWNFGFWAYFFGFETRMKGPMCFCYFSMAKHHSMSCCSQHSIQCVLRLECRNAAASQSSVTSNLLVTMSIENKIATARKTQQPCERVHKVNNRDKKNMQDLRNEKKNILCFFEAIIFCDFFPLSSLSLSFFYYVTCMQLRTMQKCFAPQRKIFSTILWKGHVDGLVRKFIWACERRLRIVTSSAPFCIRFGSVFPFGRWNGFC